MLQILLVNENQLSNHWKHQFQLDFIQEHTGVLLGPS